MDNFESEPISWVGVLGSTALLFAGYVTKRYVLPFLKVGKRQKYAQFIAAIADEVTDDLIRKYPGKKWLEYLDEAIDQLIAICEVPPQVARRAVNAAVARK